MAANKEFMPLKAPVEPDLLRDLLVALDGMQRSPPESLLLVPAELAATLRCRVADVERAIEILADLQLIEGPGAYGGGWLFRQLTPRGHLMLEEVGSERRWRRIKDTYGGAA